MEHTNTNTNNEWTTVIDKRKAKNERRAKRKLLKEQQNKKNNYRNKGHYNRRLYQKNKEQIKPETKKNQNTPKITDTDTDTDKKNIVIMANAFSNLLNEFDESDE